MDRQTRVRTLAHTRFKVASLLTAAMIVLYFGFVSLVAFAKPFLARRVMPGLSLGILFGALVIVVSWILTWVYVHWANKHYDPHLADLRKDVEA